MYGPLSIAHHNRSSVLGPNSLIQGSCDSGDVQERGNDVINLHNIKIDSAKPEVQSSTLLYTTLL